MEEGNLRNHFFCSGPRTGARGEKGPPTNHSLQRGQQWSGVSVVGTSQLLFFHFFLWSRFQVPRGAPTIFFRASIRRSDWVGTILLSNVYRPKSILYRHYVKETARSSPVFRTKAQMFAPFLGDRSWIFADVYCKSLSLRRVCCVCFLLSTITWGVFRPKYPPKNNQILVKIEQNTAC